MKYEREERDRKNEFLKDLVKMGRMKYEREERDRRNEFLKD